ncbi:hypothetical protein Tsubulata_017561 [Turnera subulata]|uniref:Uncharacterized protein n=1 Tax=Turnera subulata TaxID=218843 RepID=A0A9Q0F4V6_9ROSI|nr:hypothetical protein Tsubulata_017561 [Turnera subulata]
MCYLFQLWQKLFSNLDMMVGSDRPCDCSLWIGLLALHQTLVINPQDALVLWVFASVLYHGTWKEGVKFARENATVLERFAAEISGFSECRSDKELAVEVAQLASLVQDSLDAFVDSSCLHESMSRYPASQCSGLVFVSKKAGDATAKLFDVLVNDVASYENRREDSFINYLLLGKGDLDETRFVLGKVILQTLSGGLIGVEDVESFNRNYDSILSELSEDVIIVQRSKNGIPTALGPEVKITKKRKLLDISGQMSQAAEGDQQGMQMSVLEKKDLCSPQQEMSDKQCTSIRSENYLDGASGHMKSRMTEKQQEIVQARSEKKQNIKAASMFRMKELLRLHRYDESCATPDGEQNECRAKKYTTKLKLKRHMLHGKETKQQLDVSNSKTLRADGENDSYPSLEDVKEKTGKIKEVLTKERTGPPSLSSLFK